MTTFREDLEHRLENPDFAKEYEKQRGERELIKEIVRARNAAGVTQAQLAKKSGLRQSNISRIENGSSSPRIETLQKIADGLDMILQIRFVEKER